MNSVEYEEFVAAVEAIKKTRKQKDANYHFNRLVKLYDKLKSENRLQELLELFDNSDIDVRFYAAVFSLHCNRERALEALRNLGAEAEPDTYIRRVSFILLQAHEAPY